MILLSAILYNGECTNNQNCESNINDAPSRRALWGDTVELSPLVVSKQTCAKHNTVYNFKEYYSVRYLYER